MFANLAIKWQPLSRAATQRVTRPPKSPTKTKTKKRIGSWPRWSSTMQAPKSITWTT